MALNEECKNQNKLFEKVIEWGFEEGNGLTFSVFLSSENRNKYVHFKHICLFVSKMFHRTHTPGPKLTFDLCLVIGYRLYLIYIKYKYLY